MNYFSQYKQDEFLDKVLLNKMQNGFFIDIGAHDGISISNSLFFEKNRNWKGICIEPNPSVYDKLITNRKSLNLNVCIGDKNDNVSFNQIEGYSEMLSGITDKYDSKHIERINSEILDKGGKINTINVKMIRLDTIQELKNQIVDFISIDTEGNEFDIIKSINFKDVFVRIIVVENNYGNKEIRGYLKKFNFILVTILNTDEVYILKSEYKLNIKFKLMLWNLKNKLFYLLNKIVIMNYGIKQESFS